MFKCMDCGYEFDTPDTLKERHGLDYGYEEWDCCPMCHSTEIREGRDCEICGEVIFEGNFCEDCRNEAKEMLKIDIQHFTADGHRLSDVIDLFTEVIDEIYVEERIKK